MAWPRNWKSNPKDNSTHVLAYYTAGLISEVGRNWVLWGDLRTEYLSKDRLKAALTAQAMK